MATRTFVEAEAGAPWERRPWLVQRGGRHVRKGTGAVIDAGRASQGVAQIAQDLDEPLTLDLEPRSVEAGDPLDRDAAVVEPAFIAPRAVAQFLLEEADWGLSQRLMRILEPDASPWYSRHAWWNVYPLGWDRPGGSPGPKLRAAQAGHVGGLFWESWTCCGRSGSSSSPARTGGRMSENGSVSNISNVDRPDSRRGPG